MMTTVYSFNSWYFGGLEITTTLGHKSDNPQLQLLHVGENPQYFALLAFMCSLLI